MASGIKIPIISSIPIVGDMVNWLGDIIALPVNLGVNFGKTVFHAGGQALENIPLFAKWFGLGGAAIGAYNAAQQGNDPLGGALQGGVTGLLGGAVVGGGVGLIKGTAEGVIPTIGQAASDTGAIASGLFPSAGVQNLPSNLPVKTNGQKIG